MWPSHHPYTPLFLGSIFLGAFLGYLYWRIIDKERGVDNWSANLFSIMLFAASICFVLTLFIINNPIFKIRLYHKNSHWITINEFHRKRLEPKTIILDLRPAKAYQKFHFPNAISLDFYGEKFQKKLDNLDKSKIYLLYCSHFQICLRTEKILIHQGFHHIYYAPDLIPPKTEIKKQNPKKK